MNILKLGWINFKKFWTKDGYVNYNGRISRKEYWSTWLIYILFSIGVSIINSIFNAGFGINVSMIWAGLTFLPLKCFEIRRLHDANKSGYWVVIYNILSIFGFGFILSNIFSLFNGIIIKVYPYLIEYLENNVISEEAINYSMDIVKSFTGKFIGLGIFFIILCFALFVLSTIIFVFTLFRSYPGKNKYDNDSAIKDNEKESNAITDVRVENFNGNIINNYNSGILGEKEVKILRCSKCGKVLCVLSNGQNDEIYCCGVVMNELKANITDAAMEKHVPVVEKNGNCVTVKIGSATHPMTPEHYIDWIILVGSNNIQIAHVKNEKEAKANFELAEGEQIKNVYSYCNLHGLWAIN